MPCGAQCPIGLQASWILATSRDKILKGPEQGDPWPWPQLTAATYGRRHGEIYTLGAGTGIGKTSAWLQVGAEI